MVIGVLVSGVIEEYTINLCHGIESVASRDDVKVVVIPGKYIGMDHEEELHNKYGYCYNSLFAYGELPCFDGLIVEMASVTMYATEESRKHYLEKFDNIPHVYVAYDAEGYSSANIDNKAGLKAALEYMYKNGARKFAMLGGPENNVDAIERKECYLEFLKEHHLEFDTKSYASGSFFMECGEISDELVENNLDADAFVCANDILAKRMYESCEKYGKVPGRDVSILGFDDSNFCVTVYPTMSSIRPDVIEVGKAAYQLLMETIDGKETRKIAVPSRFILRDSIVHSGQDYLIGKKTKYELDAVTKSNVHLDDYEQLLEVEKKFKNIVYDINHESVDISGFKRSVEEFSDLLFIDDNMDYFDAELLLDLIEEYYKNWMDTTKYPEIKGEVYTVLIEFIKKMLKYCQTNDSQRGRTDTSTIYQMEAFFRDSMQLVRNAESNYARFVENLDYMSVKNAYLYIYDEPISYIQDEDFIIPDYLSLKAVLANGSAFVVPRNRQKVRKNQVFSNRYVDWNGYDRLTVFPMYAEKYLYGIIVCDMGRSGVDKAEMFVNHISASVRMLLLREENNRIVNEYEDSVRKLKEYNITLDTMSKTDPLTGLNNRRGFYVRAEKIRESYPNSNESIIIGYVDMNDLKLVNDRFGHDDGDYSLKTIGTILTDFVTENNGFAARIGGDEFAFLITVPKGDDPETYKSRLYEQFDTFNRSSIKPYNVSASVGYCLIEDGNEATIDEALEQADESLYVDKCSKKNILK